MDEKTQMQYEEKIKERAHQQVMMNFIQIKKDIQNLIDSEYAEEDDSNNYHEHPENNPEVVDAFHDF